MSTNSGQTLPLLVLILAELAFSLKGKCLAKKQSKPAANVRSVREQEAEMALAVALATADVKAQTETG